jgi:CheY-like chemotaxis protein
MTATNRRILCIDNHASRNLAVLLLERAHYEVTTAGSVPAAVELARGAHFDLFLLNHQLAEGAGAEACDELGEVAPQTPVLPYSTVTYPYRDRPAVRCGTRAAPIKPVEVSEVAGGVARVLDRRKGVAHNAS